MTDHTNTASTPRTWRTSSYSSNGGACVEVATNIPGVVPVRDSKDPHSPELSVPTAGWSTFVSAIKGGEFGV
ncbi:DUF397 domain-containing protein [Streptomyces sp. AJS327]|uniref:DUF397 domain-containing protein n=1 Tax=Streptomyces sp. AJS327 TaxID=2545265 RepID=UPI0015DFE4E6|nr:DUF397 domain-containing protein [Streptomyces sp. AJS327]MBA0050067.1 DUF397 domain-containing protein [Streptomyces sp. AJS327]